MWGGGIRVGLTAAKQSRWSLLSRPNQRTVPMRTCLPVEGQRAAYLSNNLNVIAFRTILI